MMSDWYDYWSLSSFILYCWWSAGPHLAGEEEVEVCEGDLDCTELCEGDLILAFCQSPPPRVEKRK